jgi:hypothetical protein
MIAAIVGWSLAGLFMTKWIFDRSTEQFRLYDREDEWRRDLRFALDFVDEVVEPATNDLFQGMDFLRDWTGGHLTEISRLWPEWPSYLEARRAGRSWENGRTGNV